MMRTIGWAWQQSRHLPNYDAAPTLRQRMKFVGSALVHARAIGVWRRAPAPSALGRELRLRPQAAQVLVTPYLCKEWDAATRIERYTLQLNTLQRVAQQFRLPTDGDTTQLMDLGLLSPGLRLVLDRAEWFQREGQVVLNLFIGEARGFSLAFSLEVSPGGLQAYIGAVQGVRGDEALADYRELTKALHGMRPRDFLVEVFRLYCAALGVVGIHAVRDASRHHRSRYYGQAQAEMLKSNYDELWQERGGELQGQFFRLPVHAVPRALEDVPAKKRAMYRRRQQMLDDIAQGLAVRSRTTMPGAMPWHRQQGRQLEAPVPAACVPQRLPAADRAHDRAHDREHDRAHDREPSDLMPLGA